MLSVRINGINYVLTDLSDESIRELVSIPGKLDHHIQECLMSGKNYYIQTDVNEPSTSKNQRNEELDGGNYFEELDNYIERFETGEDYCTREDANGEEEERTEVGDDAYDVELTSNEHSNRAGIPSQNFNSKQPNINAVRFLDLSKVSAASKRSCLPTSSNLPASNKLSASKNKSSASKNKSSVPKNKKQKFDEEEDQCWDELLVTLVMERPLIYNYNLATNKSAGIKAEMFRDILDEIKREFPNVTLTIADVKKRWSSVRDCYLRRRRKNKQDSGAGLKDTENGSLDEMLMALNDVYVNDPTTSNVAGLPEELAQTKPKINVKKFEDEALLCIQQSTDKFLGAISDIKNTMKQGQGQNTAVEDQNKDVKICERLILGFRELSEEEKDAAEISMLQVFRDIKKNRKQ